MGKTQPLPAPPSTRAYFRHSPTLTFVRLLTSLDFAREIRGSWSGNPLVFLHKSKTIGGKTPAHESGCLPFGWVKRRGWRKRERRKMNYWCAFLRCFYLDRSSTSYLRKFHMQDIFISGCRDMYYSTCIRHCLHIIALKHIDNKVARLEPHPFSITYTSLEHTQTALIIPVSICRVFCCI